MQVVRIDDCRADEAPQSLCENEGLDGQTVREREVKKVSLTGTFFQGKLRHVAIAKVTFQDKIESGAAAADSD
jgi:hypothetical protein